DMNPAGIPMDARAACTQPRASVLLPVEPVTRVRLRRTRTGAPWHSSSRKNSCLRARLQHQLPDICIFPSLPASKRMSLTSWNTTVQPAGCACCLNNIGHFALNVTFIGSRSLLSVMNPRQAPEKQDSAHTLEDAANSKNTLQGYAAINDVD